METEGVMNVIQAIMGQLGHHPSPKPPCSTLSPLHRRGSGIMPTW